MEARSDRAKRARERDAEPAGGGGGTAGPGLEGLPPGNVEKLRNLNEHARTRFKVGRSAIHGWGLFVKEPISRGEMLIEQRWSLRENGRGRRRPSPL